MCVIIVIQRLSVWWQKHFHIVVSYSDDYAISLHVFLNLQGSREEVELSSVSLNGSQRWLCHARRNSAGVTMGDEVNPRCHPPEVKGSKHCIWPSWCHRHSPCLASVKSRLVLVPAHLGNHGQSPAGRETCVCACVCVCVFLNLIAFSALTLLVGRQEGHPPHPGSPRHSPGSHKMIVVVVVSSISWSDFVVMQISWLQHHSKHCRISCQPHWNEGRRELARHHQLCSISCGDSMRYHFIMFTMPYWGNGSTAKLFIC